MDYLDRLDRARILATIMLNPYTYRQLTFQAYNHIKSSIKLSGPVSNVNSSWLALPLKQQTFSKLRSKFQEGYMSCLRAKYPLESATSTMAPSEGAFLVNEMTQPTAATPPSDDDSVGSSVASAFSSLTRVMEERFATRDAKMTACMATNQQQ